MHISTHDMVTVAMRPGSCQHAGGPGMVAHAPPDRAPTKGTVAGFRAAQKAVHTAGQAALPTELCWRGWPPGTGFLEGSRHPPGGTGCAWKLRTRCGLCRPPALLKRGWDLGASRRCQGNRPWELCLWWASLVDGISHMLSQAIAGELRVSRVTPCERTLVAWPRRAPSPLLGPISGPDRYPEHDYMLGPVSLPSKSLNLGVVLGTPDINKWVKSTKKGDTRLHSPGAN